MLAIFLFVAYRSFYANCLEKYNWNGYCYGQARWYMCCSGMLPSER